MTLRRRIADAVRVVALSLSSVILAAAVFSCSSQNSGQGFLLPLEGDWLVKAGDQVDASLPGFDDSSWKSLRLPMKNLLRPGLPPSGYIWLRKKVIVEAPPDTALLLQVREIMNADEIYFNGALIGSAGRFPPEFKSAWCNFRSYPLPVNIVKKGENIVAVRMYYDAEAWIMGPMRIIDRAQGTRTKIVHDFMLIHLMHSLTVLLSGIAIFFLFFFSQRKNEKEHLFFSLSCLCIAVAVALQYIENLYPDLRVSSDVIMRITQSGLLLFPSSFALYYRAYSGLPTGRLRLALYFSVPLTGIVLMSLSGNRSEIMMWRNIFLITIGVFMADAIILSVRNLLARNRKGTLMIIGIIPTVLLGVHDVLAFSLGVIESSIPLYVYGIPILLVFLAVMMATRFVGSLNRAEELNLALEESIGERLKLAAIERELELARNIHMSTIEGDVPTLEDFDVAVKFIPTDTIGGDYYSFHSDTEGRLGVFISDVSGHGVPAALIASMVKILFVQFAHLTDRPHILLAEMNRILTGSMKSAFLTAMCLSADLRERRLSFARAGHIPLLLLNRKDGELREFRPPGRAIGIVHECGVGLLECPIGPGDRVILYTDGIVECFNEENEMYGEDNFKNLIVDRAALPPAAFTEEVIRALRAWIGPGRRFEDDITLIVIDVDEGSV